MNFPYTHIFICGFIFSVVVCLLVTHICDALHIASDKDSPDWESK